MNAIFFGAFFAGLALIVGLRFFVTGLSGAILAASVAVVIILFAGWIYYRKFTDVEGRQVAGDNLYYLGLLFTLLSLILALFQLFVLDTQADVNDRANELIGNFGVALSSTVFGILGRIFFQTQQGDSEERVEQKDNDVTLADSNGLAIDTGVRELREELARLRLVLREASDAFMHYSRISSEQSEAVIAHTGAMMQRQSEDLNKVAVHQMELMNLSFKSVADAFEAEMNALSNRCTVVVNEFLSRMSAETEQGIDNTSKAWNEAAVEMTSEGERLIKALYGDVNALLLGTEQIWSKMASLTQSVSESVTGMRENTESLQSMVRDSAGAGAEMKRLLAGMSAARSELEAAAGIAGRSTQEIESSTRRFTDLQSTLATELNEVRVNAVEEYGQATAQIVNQTSEQMKLGGGKLQATLLDLANDLEDHRRIGAEQLNHARKLSNQMAEETSEWNKLSERTRKSLVEATQYLVQLVKKS